MKHVSLVNSLTITVIGGTVTGFAVILLIDSSIKSLILLALAAGICALSVRRSAATRHLIWGMTLFGVLVMPAVAMLTPEWNVLPPWLSVERQLREIPIKVDSPVAIAVDHDVPHDTGAIVAVENRLTQIAEANSIQSRTASIVPTVRNLQIRLDSRIVLALWGFGVLVCLCPIVLSYLRLKTLERSFDQHPLPIDARLLNSAMKIAKSLNLNPPRIMIGPVGSMPMVWSLFEARLLLPADAVQWTEDRLNAVLLHELVHLRRRDPSVFMMGMLSLAVNWFNPLAWYALRRLKIECERACDDSVLRMGINAGAYATHLLELSASPRAKWDSGSLAIAMASAPHVENRIVSILDQKQNRRGLTVRRAIMLIMIISTGVGLLASLAVKAADDDNDSSDVEVKWPYCIVTTDGLENRSLKDAVAAFNLDSKQSPIGRKQPPITEQETLDAIAKFVKQEHVSNDVKTTLREIQSTKIVPPNAYFRRFTRYDDEKAHHTVWWVHLEVQGTDPPVYSVPVLRTSFGSRPYTQMERQQNAQLGVTLINRFSSYFETVPTFNQPQSIPTKQSDQMVARVRKAIQEKNRDELKQLFEWRDVSESTRTFVDSELDQLLSAEVTSIEVQPVAFTGTLIHWSAYQHYEPNLPVIGYLKLTYKPKNAKTRRPKTLSLELGQDQQGLRLVNYVARGERNFPNGGVAGLSIQGRLEPLEDDTFYMTTMVANPGSLISAHLANEEIWQRDLKQKPNKDDDDQASNETGANGVSVGVNDESGLRGSNVLLTDNGESQRLVELFRKLGVEQKTSLSTEARDLPDLYQPDPNNPGEFIDREGILLLTIDDLFNVRKHTECIWIRYLPSQHRFYIEHRFDREDPYHDRLFGPYKGNLFEMLPDIEQGLLRELKQQHETILHKGNTLGTLRRMLTTNNEDLTNQVISLIDESMNAELEIVTKTGLYKSFETMIHRAKDQSHSRNAEEKLASIQKRLDAFRVELAALTLSFPDEAYLTSANVVERIPDDLAEEHWGEPVDGLRIAVVPESRVFTLLEPVKMTLVVENVGRDNIKFAVANLVQEFTPEVSHRGQRVVTYYAKYMYWPTTQRYLIKPGEKIALTETKLWAYSESRTEDQAHSLGITNIPVSDKILETRDSMKIDYELQIGLWESWSRGTDGIMRVHTPAKGEWKGTVHAASFSINFHR